MKHPDLREISKLGFDKPIRFDKMYSFLPAFLEREETYSLKLKP